MEYHVPNFSFIVIFVFKENNMNTSFMIDELNVRAENLVQGKIEACSYTSSEKISEYLILETEKLSKEINLLRLEIMSQFIGKSYNSEAFIAQAKFTLRISKLNLRTELLNKMRY
jgi:hypothetical protein